MKRNEFLAQSLHENLSGLSVSPEMKERMLKSITEGEKMKRKFHVSVALVAVLALLCATALAVGGSVFDYFSGIDARFLNVSEVKGDETRIESEALGSVPARIDSAYFDGESLLIGFMIDNANRMEAYTPGESDLENARRVIDPVRPVPMNEAEQEILDSFARAVDAGTPFGYKMLRVYASEHTLINGVDVPPYVSFEDYDEAGTYRAVREFESPLAEEIAQSQSVNVEIRLYEACTVHYFDGTDVKTYDLAIREAGAVKAKIAKTEAVKHTYTGEALIEGITFTAECELSPMQGTVRVYADKDVFELVTYEYEDYTWKAPAWQLAIFDEAGREYGVKDGYDLTGASPIEAKIKGSGEMPKEMHIYLLEAGEEPDTYDFWPIAEQKYENAHIILKIK